MNVNSLKNDLDSFDAITPLDGYTSTRTKEKERIKQSKDGTLPQGLKAGYEVFDMYFRYKLSNLVIINGHANVGKSFLVWYLMTIAAHKHNWKWIMFCGENMSADIRTRIVEFKSGAMAHFIPDDVFEENLNWAYDHFEIIELEDDNTEIETADLILKISEMIIKEKGRFHGLLIDPYNALQMDMTKMETRLSTHDYHYLIATKFRKFNKKHNMTTWINMHAVSEALRRVDEKGYPKPPHASDTEGGGKWINRADEFMTFHRYVQDSSRSKTTEIHVRKVKDTYTGGKPTDLNMPVELHWETHYKFYGFYDNAGRCPLSEKGLIPKVEKLPVTKNQLQTFESEKPNTKDLIDDLYKDKGDAPF